MSAARSSTYDRSARGPDPGGRRRRLLRGVLAAVCAFAVPVAPAFGEGSADLNTGPGTQLRQALQMSSVTTPGFPYFHSILYVYARAGETVQLGHSAMQLAGGTDNIFVYAPGTDIEAKTFPTDPVFATDIFDCNTDDPGTGRIASRAQELAGPEPSAGDADPATWAACEFTPTQDGVYPIVMMPYAPSGSALGPNLDDPDVTSAQGQTLNMWDITVRAAGDAVQPGRAFSRTLTLITGSTGVSGLQVFPYTKTGYEWNVEMPDEGGVSWQLYVDDMGVIDKATGQRTFESFHAGQPVVYSDRGASTHDRRFPMFFNRADPVVITGDNGLSETLGYSPVPISQASTPLSSLAFTGSGGQTGGTNHGSAGTITFDSPPAMEGLGYTIALDLNRDGTFGNANDVVDATGELPASGKNSFAWNGRDAAGAVPPCGDYQYQIRSTLGEVHFPEQDVENSGGKRFERLSLPNDPTLGNPLAASYDNLDRSKTPPIVTVNTTPIEATNAISGPGFNSWTDGSGGDNDYVDTWARLPEVQSTGTLSLLCADLSIVKTATPSPAVPGEQLTYTLAVKNDGAATAANVRVSDPLPAGLTFVSASPECSAAGANVTCAVPSLAAGASQTFTVTASVASSVTGSLTNTATVGSDTPDPDPDDNTSTTTVPTVGRSGLIMTKTASTPTVATGGQVMYTLVVRNEGPSDDPDVKVTDPLPAGLTLVAAEASQGSCTTTSNTVSCDLGALKDEGSAQVLVTANVTATSGCITNVARAQGSRQDPNAADNQASAQVCVPTVPPAQTTFDLAVDKRASVTRPVIGQRVTYTIAVRNNGPGAAPEAKLTDTYNNRATVVSVRTTQGTCTRELPITCELGRIESGRSVTITMVITPLESGSQRNSASATSCCGNDRVPGNNIDTVGVSVQKVPLRVTKVASSASVRAGSTLNYRIRVSNPSKGVARNVRVCDRLPSGLSFVRSTPRASRSGSSRCWTISSLGAGKSRSFRVTVRAAQGASGRKVNRATVSSADVRPATARRPVRVVGGRPGVTG